MKTIVELVIFFISRGKLWLIPIVLTAVLFGLVLLGVQGSIISPFVYTLF